MHADRRAAALEAARGHASALLVTALPNLRYLTGFTGSAGRLLLADDPLFLTDGRYLEQSAQQVPDVEREIHAGGGHLAALAAAVADRGITTLAFEAGHPEPGGHGDGYVTVAELDRLRNALPDVELVGVVGIVERLRVRKDRSEIDSIRRAQRIAEQALVGSLRTMRPGTESELALRIEWELRTSGAEGVSFDTIVATGAHAALPHARPRPEPRADGVLLIDMGARLDGYCSDMTRTYLSDAAPDELRRAHAAVVRAVEAACVAVRPGARCADVDGAARGVLEREGFGEAFVHSTGHGVGLEVHEPPRLAPTSEAVLEAGMVVTIEPGVYLSGVGGIRVEDLVVVTEQGAENLTALPRGPDLPG